MLAPHLEDLNPEQLTAVQHGNGPLLIFAGAGSGKTRVLTRRIANLIIEHQVHPEQILAVTFTNKAASEMKQRVIRLFGGSSAPMWVSTFHATCARMLRVHGERLGYRQNFAIYDANDSRSLLKRVFEKLQIDPRVIDIRMVAARIDRAKNDYRSPDDLRADRYTPGPLAEIIADAFEVYQKELLNANAMDFGDLLCNVVTLLKFEKDILAHYQQKFQQILIDEYQDTNRVQYLLVKLLADQHKNLCVVGDDDQSIYAFRGATIENILNFKKDFPDATVVTLEQNYRSTKTILQAANAVITKNAKRQKKTLRTDNAHGHPIACYRGHDENDEAEFVSREIITLAKQGVDSREIAIFYRTNAQSRALEEALVECGIPYEIFGGHRFYERKEIKDILAYFRLLVNPDDNEAFLRVINTPTRGLGAISIGNLASYAASANLSLVAALRLVLDKGAPWLNGGTKVKLTSFIKLLDELTTDGQTAALLLSADVDDAIASGQLSAIAKLLESIAVKTTYLTRLKDEDTPEAQSRMENIYELCNVATEFVRNNIAEGLKVTLQSFLDRASLTSDLDRENTSSAANAAEQTFRGPVSLMTLHLAKGLEFDIIFLVGLEEGILPHIRSLDNQTDLEEERRLCYVGITRARKRLYISRAESRITYGRGGGFSGIPSRFLDDLPPELVEERTSGFMSQDWRYGVRP